ncbi:MAG: glutathione S-transferase [Rhodospirillaceae bacterium]|nr:glutathione S-transferase [Rhodospirillaceae bacterium]
MLKVWGRKNSINVQKVLWCCDELGVAFERVDAGGAFGVVDDPAYRDLNPNGVVPTIEDGGFVLWESNTIVRYLAARYGAGGLWPDDPVTRADGDRWMDWQQTVLLAPMTTIFWGLIRTPPESRDMAKIAAAAKKAHEAFAMLDKALTGRAFVTGDRFTMGDIPVGAMAFRWLNLDVEDAPRPSLPALEAWYARLLERPAYRTWVAQPMT